MDKNITIEQYLQLNPIDLNNVLRENFIFEIPHSIDTLEDMQEVGSMLSITSNQYSFLNSLLSMSKIYCRNAKRLKAKELYEDCIDRKEVINNVVESVKTRHKTLSRMITIKQEINHELQMSESRVFKS